MQDLKLPLVQKYCVDWRLSIYHTKAWFSQAHLIHAANSITLTNSRAACLVTWMYNSTVICNNEQLSSKHSPSVEPTHANEPASNYSIWKHQKDNVLTNIFSLLFCNFLCGVVVECYCQFDWRINSFSESEANINPPTTVKWHLSLPDFEMCVTL